MVTPVGYSHRRRITTNYLEFANYYLAARNGDLDNADPTFW